MNIPGYSVFHNKALSGGGVLYSTAVHTLDFANWIIGNPTPVAAMGNYLSKGAPYEKPGYFVGGDTGRFRDRGFRGGLHPLCGWFRVYHLKATG